MRLPKLRELNQRNDETVTDFAIRREAEVSCFVVKVLLRIPEHMRAPVMAYLAAKYGVA